MKHHGAWLCGCMTAVQERQEEPWGGGEQASLFSPSLLLDQFHCKVKLHLESGAPEP